jgi:hypothetical protein
MTTRTPKKPWKAQALFWFIATLAVAFVVGRIAAAWTNQCVWLSLPQHIWQGTCHYDYFLGAPVAFDSDAAVFAWLILMFIWTYAVSKRL